ncbi:hypothetical protein ACJRO7_034417 [Eucalyptus globulus]|uniref:NB-ARC domain-containing protein n=1 Tax=Eucalyptus globulus TaxID=34317 RepID=A0ABD3J2V0_EUCGL
MAASDTESCMIVYEAAAQIVLQKLDILAHYPVCVECIPTRTRVEDAKAKLARIQEFFSTQFKSSKPTEWSGRLLRAMYYAEEFIDKFHLREAREKHKALHMAARPLTALVSKYKLGRDLTMLVKKMEELCDEKFLKEEAEGKGKKKSASSSSLASVPWQGKTLVRLTSFWDRQASTNFSFREAEKKKIMEWMKAVVYKEIGIWGEQGTGKTFLARWAYSQAKFMGYECRAWVRVSPSMDKREFLLEILKQVEKLAGDVMNMNIKEINKKLFQKLAKAKKFLIVLDDVQLSDWREILLELWNNTPHGPQGHIITTTRDKSIASYVSYGTQPIELKELDDKESKRMLAWKLHRVSDGQTLSEEKEKDILNICHGLPLHISLLGGFLSNAGEHDHAALAKEGSAMTMLDILQLSCLKLPVHLKPRFIYMALFPIAFPIPTRRLVRLWLAEGLLDSHCYDMERKPTRKPEDVGETFILELADRNVIDVVSWRADGSPKACQMLTSLYDMICPIAMSTGFLHIRDIGKSKGRNDHDPTRQQQQLPAQLRERSKIRWLAEHTTLIIDDRDGSYCDLNLGHVCSFLSFYQRRGVLTKDISTLLRKMTSENDYSLLRVLDLEGVSKPSLQGLRSTVLDSIPSDIADLDHLETLDIKHTNITSLPSSFWKARNLRHLHLNWFYVDLKKILKACGDNVVALTKLQTLSGLVISEVKEDLMTGHVNCLTTLTTLKLFLKHSDNDTTGAPEKTVADWISFGLTSLRSLTFGVIQEAKVVQEDTKVDNSTKKPRTVEEAKHATSQIGLLPELSLAEQHHDLLELYLLGQLNKPKWTQLLPVSLRVLTLSGSKVEADMMPELGGLLRNLRTLRLLANSFRGTCLTFAKGGFPSLKILKIWKLPLLQKVIIAQGAMLLIQELEFRHLDANTKVEGIKNCKQLENIYVVFKKGAWAFVEHLEGEKAKTQNLCKIEETKTDELTDD